MAGALWYGGWHRLIGPAMRALALLLAVPTLAFAQPSGRLAMKPDFAAVDSVAKATTLAAQGRLVPILLFPEEFGGENRVENRVYITPEAAEARTLILGDRKSVV